MSLRLLQGFVFTLACILLEVEAGPNLPQLVTTTECGRYSLDALYYDAFKPQADAIVSDAKQFISTVADKMYDSFQRFMMQLPGRDQSDADEKRLYKAFETMKRTFAKKVDKAMENVTEAWEQFLPLNHQFLLGKAKPTRQEVVDKVDRIYDCYKIANETMEKELSMAVIPLKGMVMNSVRGIQTVFKMVAESANDQHQHRHHNEHNHGSNTTDDDDDDDDDGVVHEDDDNSDHDPHQNDNSTTGETPEKNPYSNKTLSDIIQDLVPNFLGRLSENILNDEAELILKTDRFIEYHLEKLTFDAFMIRVATRRLLNPKEEMDENYTDLTRRNLHMFWVERTNRVFQAKLQEPTDTKAVSMFPMETNEQLVDTMVAMLQRYP